MAVYVRCESCFRRNALKHETCTKCGEKLPRGRAYYIVEWRFRGEGGKWISRAKALGKVNRHEALEWEVDKKREVRRKKAVQEYETEDVTLIEAIEQYRHYLKTKKPQFNQNTITKIFDRMYNFFGNCRLNEITVKSVQQWMLEVKNEGLAEATCDRHLAFAKALWKYSVPSLQCPFSRVKPYHPQNQLTRYLSDDEEARLLEAIRQDRFAGGYLYEMVVVALHTGFRLREVRMLKRDQVDFDRRIITVRQKGDQLHVVPMSEELCRVLSNVPDNGTEYFWVNKKTGKPYYGVKKAWSRCKKRAGIDRPFRFHDLRHHVASLIVSKTGNLKTASEFLGHKHYKTTSRYAHLLPGYMREVINVLDKNADHAD